MHYLIVVGFIATYQVTKKKTHNVSLSHASETILVVHSITSTYYDVDTVSPSVYKH